MNSSMPGNEFEFRALLLSLERDRLCLFPSVTDTCCLVCPSSQSRCTQNTRKLCLPTSAEPQLYSIQQLRAAEKAKLASVTVAAVGGVSYAGDLPDSSASEQTRREQDELMPKHELFPNAATCAEPEGHSLQLAQLQVRQREQS